MTFIKRVLKPNGLLYVNDFLLCSGITKNLFYKKQQRKFKTYGVFETYDGAVVRHHDERYIFDLLAEFKKPVFEKYELMTMNSNKACGFNFIGANAK